MEEEIKNSQNDEEKVVEFNQEKVLEKIVSDYDLDVDEDEDLILKLLEDKKAEHLKLSNAIGQKIKYRTELSQLKTNSASALPKEQPKESAKEAPIEVSKTVQEILDKRDLEEMGLPEDLEKELRKLASIQNISIKKAALDPYFIYKKEEFEKTDRVSKASISNKNNGTQATIDTSSVPEVDLSTEEGRKKWEDYKKALEKNSKK